MGLFLQYAWLIPLFPLLSFAIITLTPIRKSKAASGWLAIGLMVAATVVALGVGGEVAQGIRVKEDGTAEVLASGEAHTAEGETFAFPEANIVRTFRWAPAGGDASVTMGYYIDPAAAAMLLMVTITSTCIHLFSMGYMAHDERQSRFFSFISLFTAAMLLMVLASNLLLFFIAWELMGLCSYLLIGFWYDKVYPDPRQITPRQAAIKAFITTRVGDVLFMVGLAYLWTQAGSLDFGSGAGQIFNSEFLQRIASTPNMLGISVATGIALLLFAGTVGKSAQFPLHVWLPDAMEGPTPVSALIHAATMVAAGVFLVGRTYPIFVVSGALPVVAFIGSFTALFAALIAVAQFDIKRILAYSTISQLGFMVAALGIGGWVAAIFHLLTHAFFKALLFLGSGSVIHGMEGSIETALEEKGIAAHGSTVDYVSGAAQDIRNMGNLRKFMPITFITYAIGYLALAGIPPLAGFWSKDEILADAFGNGHYIVWGVLTIAAFLTAFYMTRQVAVVFFGTFRGYSPRVATHPSEPKAVEHANEHGDEHAGEHAHGGPSTALRTSHDPHESPWTMWDPLAILAVFAALAGFANVTGGLTSFFFPGKEAEAFNFVTAGIATVLALLGIGLGWMLYRNAFATAADLDPLEQRMPGVFRVLNRKFYFDELYANTFGKLSYALAWLWNLLDRYVLDGLLRLTAAITVFFGRLNFIIDDTVLNDGADALTDGTYNTGDAVRQAETGKIQDYASLIFAGVVVLGLIYLYTFNR